MDAASTCWDDLAAVARGEQDQRRRIAERYLPVVRGWLQQRWRAGPRREQVDDAVQEVFVECLRTGGAVARAVQDGRGAFGGFLYGVARNVARRWEQREGRRREQPLDGAPDPPLDETSQSRAFDRLWARTLIAQAQAELARTAATRDEAARERVALLRARFVEGLPIRDIARERGQDPAHVHRQYALARSEFHRALRDVLRFHDPDDPRDLDGRCRDLLDLLG